MILDKTKWSSMFACSARLMKANKSLLSQIDSKFGDGDHGVTIAKIADIFEVAITEWKSNDWTLKEFLIAIGDRVINVSGGSAGPLYGTFLSGLGACLGDERTSDATLLKRILRSGLDELQDLTNAKVGDKTMMDTLIPAIDAATQGPDDVVEILRMAQDAAIAGCKTSEGFISKFGRAKSYKEATIGTPDAGAISCTYIFIGFYEAVIS